MQVRLGVVMDPIGSIQFYKDSTLAMLLAAQERGWELRYMEQGDLVLNDGTACAHMRGLTVHDDAANWYQWSKSEFAPLDSLHAILMRKDPPADMEYIYATMILARAEAAGVLVVN